MSEFTPLRESLEALAERAVAPDFRQLQQRAARRRRRRGLAVTTAVVALICGSVFAVIDPDERSTTIGDQPKTSQPDVRTSPPVPTAPPGSAQRLEEEIRVALSNTPQWAIVDRDPTIINPCAGDWSESAEGMSGGDFGAVTDSQPPQIWHDVRTFPTTQQAQAAVDRLRSNLTSCATDAWQIRSIPGTEAVLASSPTGVVWIATDNTKVTTLQVPTTDGPPPTDLQSEIATLLREDIH